VLASTLTLIQSAARAFADKGLKGAEPEAFGTITQALLTLRPKSKTLPLPHTLAILTANTAETVRESCDLGEARVPLARMAGASTKELAVKSFAPRMEAPSRYNISKDRRANKSRDQAEADRLRRDYKREHKAVKRELRLDSAFVETERREQYSAKTGKSRQKRNKNFSWLEQEQANMNQQVAKGGELLRGGGMGAARAKAASGKMGVKKGGKFRS
jgi:nucleolar protein 14